MRACLMRFLSEPPEKKTLLLKGSMNKRSVINVDREKGRSRFLITVSITCANYTHSQAPIYMIYIVKSG